MKSFGVLRVLFLVIPWSDGDLIVGATGRFQGSFPLAPCSCCAFAGGGFGAKTSRPRSKKKKRKGGLQEFSAPKKDGPAEKQQQLDKWGLPVPTDDDIFPRMPVGTELLTVKKERYSLQEIQQALKNHISLQLEQSFDEEGVELKPPPNRPPMKLLLLHQSPPVLAIDNFFTPEECLEVEHVAMPPPTSSDEESSKHVPVQVDSATFSPLAQSKRTSTSWFCHYSQVPVLLTKARHRLGIPLEQMEEPQIVRYKTGQEFSWHYDEVPPSQLDNGGQRLATLLVYLNTVQEGGSTIFRDLKDRTGNMLGMQPRQGSALLFFPAFADGRPDDRTLHKGQVAQDEKRIVQMWMHERAYQAALPPGNSQNAAMEAVEQVCESLGYS